MSFLLFEVVSIGFPCRQLLKLQRSIKSFALLEVLQCRFEDVLLRFKMFWVDFPRLRLF